MTQFQQKNYVRTDDNEISIKNIPSRKFSSPTR